MATKTESVLLAGTAPPAEPTILDRIRFLVWPASMPMSADAEALAMSSSTDAPPLTLFERFRKFLWLSSGLFSAASFAIPVVGLMAFGSFEGIGTNFLVAVVSACLFGLASVLHFGPDEA